MTSLKLPPPPVPQKLREMLKDYPGHIERLQEALNTVVEKPSRGTPPFEVAIWMLEGALEEFMSEAGAELEAAEASGDADVVARAKAKERLMGRASSSSGGMLNLHELKLYFDGHKEAFE